MFLWGWGEFLGKDIVNAVLKLWSFSWSNNIVGFPLIFMFQQERLCKSYMLRFVQRRKKWYLWVSAWIRRYFDIIHVENIYEQIKNKIKPCCFGNHFSVLYDSCVVTDLLCGNCFFQTAKYFPYIVSFSKWKMQTALESFGNKKKFWPPDQTIFIHIQ